MRLSRKYIDLWLRLYSCDVNKNKECNKKNCAICYEDDNVFFNIDNTESLCKKCHNRRTLW